MSPVASRGFLRVAALVILYAVSIAAVVARARRDAADPARCAGLVPMHNRCCAVGQVEDAGRCRGRPAQCPAGTEITDEGCAALARRALIEGGVLHAGAGDWEAEGRVTAHEARIAPFELDAYEATERDYEACMGAGQCGALPLTGEPGRVVGGVTRADAEAYCAFRGGRLPSDDEWTFAAGGPKARRYPWGDTGAVCRRGVWGLVSGPCGYGFAGPEMAGAHPDGASPEGVHDLAGNVAEWVSGVAGEQDGAVRGGSFVSALATDLRTWQTRRAPPTVRSPDVGVRCAYNRASVQAPSDRP